MYYSSQTPFVQLVRKAALTCLVVSIPMYVFLAILFYEFDLSFREWSEFFLEIAGTCWLVVFSGFLLFHFAGMAAEKLLQFRARHRPSLPRLSALLVIASLAGTLVSCKGGLQPIGKHVDLVTGLSTEYKGIVPTGTNMIMNNEVLNHTDIPLGEHFTIQNTGVTGLTVKDNKVSLGCSLLISDKDGRKMLFEPDLFKDNAVYDKDSVRYLKCDVGTGSPMEWQKKYLVKVTYWDKFGTGKLENSVTISMQDEP